MARTFRTGPVKVREGRIVDLIKLYKLSYAKLASEIVTATEAGKIHRIRVMVRINRELESLGVDVEKWVRSEIPQYYRDGMNQALQQMRAAGMDVRSTKQMATINREAMKVFTDEVSLAFADGITGISRNANRVLTDTLRQQINMRIAMGRLEGAALRTIVAGVKDELRRQGLSALTDRAGRRWTFDRYAEMLARTKAVEARNQGLANMMLQNGYDLVEVSNHRSEHKACAFWEGKILSLTGQTKGYPTYEEARKAGIFHPNCKHSINVITDLSLRTKAYDNPYNYR